MLSKQIIDSLAMHMDSIDRDLMISPVSGGDINQCFKVTNAQDRSAFVKVNANKSLLAAEYKALERITALGVANYPSVIVFFETPQSAVLVLEYEPLRTVSTMHDADSVAEALVAQHRIFQDQFGWYDPGFIGFSEQSNEWQQDWLALFAEHRLQPQLKWAKARGLSDSLAQKVEWLIDHLHERIDAHSIRPALLHGDLWTGNVSMTQQGGPFFYDPAPYFGDAEVDIAMTRLFGALPESFYHTYRHHNPEPADFKERMAIYNLYHALNHFVMFGQGYSGLVNKLSSSVV